MKERDDSRKLAALEKLCQGNYKAFLYDCDGTLADNMAAHKESYIRVASKFGVTIGTEIIDEFAGLPIPRVVEEINKRYASEFDPEEFEAMKSAVFYDEFIQATKPVAFVVEHLKASAGKVKIGVVSGGKRQMIQKTLEVLGISHLVDVLVCAGDTDKGKPYPDPFLYAAQKLRVERIECLVFEDGEAGTNAAEKAGMKWIRIDKII